MLTAAENELLTQVGPGTPMGALLRRYWMPVAGTSEFEAVTVKPLRLFGEDLVLYKDLSAQFGLLDRHCPHRRADLANGFVEKSGLRCSYHGFLMDESGRCLEQPYEDTANPEARVRDPRMTKAYPVREFAGLLWTYMGPEPAPELPVWEPFTWKNGFVEVVISEVPCNWLQAQENSCDPVHFEWMHDNWSLRLRGETGRYAPRHLKVGFEEFEYGLLYKRIREGKDETDPLWTTGRVTLWPNGFYLGEHFEWRVPIDDKNTLSIAWFFSRVPKEQEPYTQDRIPTWHCPLRDENGRWITSHIMNQDFVTWIGQGAVADRTKENLVSSDRGIVMMRRRLFRDLDAIAAGNDPSGIIRDPECARFVALPLVSRKLYTEGMTRREFAEHWFFKQRLTFFPWAAAQPAEVWDAYARAMGIETKRGDSEGS